MPMQNKPFITILLSLLFSLLLYFPSHAQGNSGMTMEIEPAFEGHFKFGEWLPVWVEIENDGPDRKAEVHVKVTGPVARVNEFPSTCYPTAILNSLKSP